MRIVRIHARLVSLMSFVEVVRLDWKQLKASGCVYGEVVAGFKAMRFVVAQH